MAGFNIITPDQIIIRFTLYSEAAPVTSKAFTELLPFTRVLFHARVSGQEFWTNEGPALDIIQENASVFTEPGEVVLGPLKPERTKTAHCLGVYYGEGRGLDAANIFAKVVPDDFPALITLGEKIWKEGQQELTFVHNGEAAS